MYIGHFIERLRNERFVLLRLKMYYVPKEYKTFSTPNKVFFLVKKK